MLARAAADLAPHDVAFYLRDLAAAFHSYYAAERFLVDDAALARARLALLAATRQVLRNGLAVLGVERAGRDGARAARRQEFRSDEQLSRSAAVRVIVGLIVGLLVGPGACALARRAVRDQGAGAVRQQGAAAHRRAGRRREPRRTATGTRTRRCPARAAAKPPPPRSAPRRAGAGAAAVGAARRASARRRHRAQRRPARPAPPRRPGGAARAAPPDRGADPFTYFVQAGAYARTEDAEQQRAKPRDGRSDGQGDRARAVRPHRVPRARRARSSARRTPTRRRRSSTAPASKRRWCACRR